MLLAFSPTSATDGDGRPELLLAVAKKLRKEALGGSGGLGGAAGQGAGVELCARLVRAGLAPSAAAAASAASAACAGAAVAAAHAEGAAGGKAAFAAAKAAAVAARAAAVADAAAATAAAATVAGSSMAWLSGVLEAQLLFLEGLAASRRLAAAAKSVRRLVLHWGEVGAPWRPLLLRTYLQLLAHGSALTGPAAAAAAALARGSHGGGSAFVGLAVVGQLCLDPAHAARFPAGTAETWRAALLQRYGDVVLSGAHGPAPPRVLASFAPLLPRLVPTPAALVGDGGESEPGLLASALKLLKKCPEAVAPALASLLQHVQVFLFLLSLKSV